MGAPAVEPPKNSTWRSSAPAGTTEHMMSAAVTRRGEPQEPSVEQARESSDEWRFDQPPMGGHRVDGQARDGVNLVLLVSLVGWVCSSSAQKEAKKRVLFSVSA